MRDEELERMAANADEEARGEFCRRIRTIEDFRYDEVQEKYWDTTTGTLLGGKSVDGAIPRDEWPTVRDEKGKPKPVRPSVAINDVMTGLTVEGSTWWPGEPQFILDTVVTSRGAMRTEGAVTYNTYVSPNHEDIMRDGEAGLLPDPKPWIEHILRLFPEEIEHNHFFDYAAHMVQRPHEKVNHGIVIAGEQGIGKDTALHPLRVGVGQWNTAEIEPDAISSQYNGYIQAVMLIINEVRPHDEDHKASNFYNQIKPYLAAPPDMLPMTLKYANTIYVRNLMHVFLTTNDPLTMFIPPEDRRLFVMTSPLPDPKKVSTVFPDGYFDQLWRFLLNRGTESVIFWLKSRPISEFNPALPPVMTRGKRAIIESARHVRRTAVDDLFEKYSETQFDGEMPDVIFGKDLHDFLREAPYFDDAETIRKLLNAKNFHFKMSERGYDMVKNPHAAEWVNRKFRSRVAFVKKEVASADQSRLVQDELSRRPLGFSFERND